LMTKHGEYICKHIYYMYTTGK